VGLGQAAVLFPLCCPWLAPVPGQVVPAGVGLLCALASGFKFPSFAHSFGGFICFVIPLLIIQLGQWKSGDLLFVSKMPRVYRVAFYALITYCIIGFGIMKSEEFIYFQF